MRVSASSMLARVRRLEQLHVSPILKSIGSLEAWECILVDSIEEGVLCPIDGPHLFHSVRRWVDVPPQIVHPLLTLIRTSALAIPKKSESPVSSVPAAAVQTNTQADHEREYQEFRKRVPEGVRQYLQAKKQQVYEAAKQA